MLLKNAFIYTDGSFNSSDLLIINEKQWIVGKNLSSIESKQVIDLTGKYIIPGLVDVHVHLREPGFDYKETILTGSKSAAKGGFTSICAMPNVIPAPDNINSIKMVQDIINKDACINVYQYGCITENRQGKKTTEFSMLKDYVTSFSDDGNPVSSDLVMKEAINKASFNDVLIAAHCEDFSYDDPRMSEYMNIKRDIELIKDMNITCRYHVCHVSSKKSIELIREAKKQGISITCETAPHYLIFTNEDVISENFKMNPPLGDKEDKQALLQAICDGTIDMIATDHAPHTHEDKLSGAMGVIGLETAFSSMYTYLVETGLINLERLVELMAINPATTYRIPGYSDFTVLDTDADYIVKADTFLSKGRNTPFEGMRMKGRIIKTICKGKIVWEFTQ
ncbi:MAG TPA: dihydroorotase [Clostridia bacterium]|nr:MAG: Dihydroorotase [Firmicutes bacterium ADurb.Bin146]HOD94005.1 dihydroorotase [Clostridia bacterium]HQM40088.1 dihydroorotase [Clostridia bacterium]